MVNSSIFLNSLFVLRCVLKAEKDMTVHYRFECQDNVDKGFETNTPFSWITSSFEEDAQSGATTQSTLSHESDSLWRQVSYQLMALANTNSI